MTFLRSVPGERSFPALSLSSCICIVSQKLADAFSSHISLKSIIMAPSVSDNQCEVVLVGCGAPLRGMGWCVRKKDE
jgi:hypothetical protein